MTTGRWYPTIVTLGDGTNIIISGSTKNLDFSRLLTENVNNPTYEYFPSKPGAWPKPLEILNWAYPLNLYPPAAVLPSGGLFLFVCNKSVIIDTKTDNVMNLPDAPITDHAVWIYPHTPTYVSLPMTIKNKWQYEGMVCGGNRAGVNINGNSAMCMRIKPDLPNAQWTVSTSMPNGRVMPDSVILPGIIWSKLFTL